MPPPPVCHAAHTPEDPGPTWSVRFAEDEAAPIVIDAGSHMYDQQVEEQMAAAAALVCTPRFDRRPGRVWSFGFSLRPGFFAAVSYSLFTARGSAASTPSTTRPALHACDTVVLGSHEPMYILGIGMNNHSSKYWPAHTFLYCFFFRNVHDRCRCRLHDRNRSKPTPSSKPPYFILIYNPARDDFLWYRVTPYACASSLLRAKYVD